MDRKGTISLLWVVVMFNMAFADILSFILPGSLQDILSGDAAPFRITQAMLLVFAVLIEIPIAMTIVSRFLRRRINRVVNIVAAAVTTAFVVGGGSATLHYLFLAGVEVVAMVLIVLLCVRWRSDSERSEAGRHRRCRGQCLRSGTEGVNDGNNKRQPL